MKRLDIDLRSAQRAPRWLVITNGVSLAVLALLQGGVAWLQSDVRAIEARLAALKSAAGDGVVARAIPSAPLPHEAGMRDFLAEARAPWLDLLQAVESTSVEGVSLERIDISAPNLTIKVDVTAQVPTALLGYVEALNAGGSAPQWSIVTVRQNGQTKQSGYAAVLSATWR